MKCMSTCHRSAVQRMNRTKTWRQPQPRKGGNHEAGTWGLNKPAGLSHLGPRMSYVPCVLRMQTIPVFPKQLITKHRISSQTLTMPRGLARRNMRNRIQT